MTNKQVYNSLANRYVAVGTSARFCEQLAEIYGCYVPADRIGFVKTGTMGRRGFMLPKTNPTDPTLDCSDIPYNPHRVIDLCRKGIT